MRVLLGTFWRVLSLLLCFVAGLPLGAQSWRLSDSLGNDRGAAPQARAGTGWILKVEGRDHGEQRTLFQNGKEDSLRLVDLDVAGRVLGWKDFRGGVPVWEVAYDPLLGVPVRETVFEGGQPSEVSELFFEKRVLIKRVVNDGAGAPLFEDLLFHWPDGSLRRLERTGPDGPLAGVSWGYGSAGLSDVWTDDTTTGEHRALRFSSGRTEETIATEAVVLLSRITEAIDGGTRETKTQPGEQKEVRVLDADGRPKEEVTTLKGTVLVTKRWKYDGQGRVLEAVTESAGPLEVWSYVYEGTLVKATLTSNGVLVREETSLDGEKQQVNHYDRSELFLVETWTGGRRVKETYYSKGQIIRERTL